jgi:hypothetical protein
MAKKKVKAKTKTKPKTSDKAMQDMHKTMDNKKMFKSGNMNTQFKSQRSSNRGK